MIKSLGLPKCVEPLLKPAFAMAFGELCDERGRRHELHGMPGQDRFAPERHCKMRLADTGRAEQQHILAIGDPARSGELAHLFGVDRGLGRRSRSRRGRARTGSARASMLISIRRSSLRAISRSQNRTRVSRDRQILPACFVEQAVELIADRGQLQSGQHLGQAIRGRQASEASSEQRLIFGQRPQQSCRQAGGRHREAAGRAQPALNPATPWKCAGSMARCRRPAHVAWTATSWLP